MSLTSKGGLGLLVGLLIAGCGGGTEEPTFPDIKGTYAGTWSQQYTLDGQVLPVFTCACTFLVPSQTFGNFWARSTLSAPCDAGLIAAGRGFGMGSQLSVSDGTIDASGVVEFHISEEPRVGLAGNGCTVTAMDPFRGSLSGNTLTASRVEGYDCTAGGIGVLTVSTRLTVTR